MFLENMEKVKFQEGCKNEEMEDCINWCDD